MPSGKKTTRTIHKIIIHCADTPSGKDFHAADIDRWHKERGWRCIGYHFVITLDGTVENGRSVDEIGAHCKGHNHDSIGICLIGSHQFTVQQWQALQQLVCELEANHPTAEVYGHNEFNSHKTCPNFYVPQWITDPARIEKLHQLEV
ncbi:MAG: N-acetylmuramoyl-L-alanine amidase [Mariprofundaceae bacterium]|nr:N-acetylmuramoyl-L-alanine amidase [Mariprofundaceae bacterium]